MSSRNSVLSDKGYNFLHWDCDKDGCFNVLCRLKFHIFAECFPGSINFSDVDGIVEIGGHGLMLEWKKRNVLLPEGQRIMYSMLTKNAPLTVLCVVGNAETMKCTHYSFFYKGKYHKPVETNLDGIKTLISRWADKHRKNVK